MKLLFPSISIFVVTLGLLRGYQARDIFDNLPKEQAQASAMSQSQLNEFSRIWEPSKEAKSSFETEEETEKNFEISSLGVDLSVLEALEVFQNALAENKDAIKDVDLIETSVGNIRGYIVADDQF